MIKYISLTATLLVAFVFLANYYMQASSSSLKMSKLMSVEKVPTDTNDQDVLLSINEPLEILSEIIPDEVPVELPLVVDTQGPRAAYREQAKFADLQDFSTNLPLAFMEGPIGQKVYLNGSDETAISFTHEDINRLAPHLGLLVTNASPSLAYRDGYLRGIEIGRIQEDSILHNFGFEMGDIITHINGSKINDPFEIVLALKNLRSNQLQIDIDRNSSVESLQFLLPD